MAEVFPNAPVVWAIFEVRFQGETSVEVARPKIQEAVRGDLPKLYVPRAAAGTAPALQHYEFRADDDSEGIGIAINSFSYYTRRYTDFSNFRSRFQRFFAEFSRHVRMHRLTRVGLRYINHIPILRESVTAAIPLEDYLNVGFKLPASIPANLTELNSVFTVRKEPGDLRMVLQHKKSEAPPQSEILVLDFDFSQANNLDAGAVDVYLEEAHTHTKQIFLDLISEKYLPVMRGAAK